MYDDKALSEYLASIKSDRSMTSQSKALVIEHLKNFITYQNTRVAPAVEVIEPVKKPELVKEPYAFKEKQISQGF